MRSLTVLALTWIYIVLAAIPALPLVLWGLCFGRETALRFIYAEGRWGVRLLLRLAGVRVRVHGRHNIPAAGAVLFMANHQSNLDPPVLLIALPGLLSVLVKRELFRVPLLGTLMRVAGLVPIMREDREQARAAVSMAAEQLRRGRPFFVFPEGTRSPDGGLLPFKKGPFHLAQQAEAQVVAVSIDGTRHGMPKGSWRIRPAEVRVQIHAPIRAAAFAEREALSAEVRRRIASGLSSAE